MQQHTYEVQLNRQKPNAGPQATMRINVQAQNDRAAKQTAEGQWPGYKATGAWRKP